jgi:hypothetical protein
MTETIVETAEFPPLAAVAPEPAPELPSPYRDAELFLGDCYGFRDTAAVPVQPRDGIRDLVRSVRNSIRRYAGLDETSSPTAEIVVRKYGEAVLALDDAGRIEPPLHHLQKKMVREMMNLAGARLEEEPAAGPTDLNEVPTGDSKQ